MRSVTSWVTSLTPRHISRRWAPWWRARSTRCARRHSKSSRSIATIRSGAASAARTGRKASWWTRRAGHVGFVCAAFVHDLQRHAVLDGLAHGVFVDVVAEDLLRLVDRRPGIANPGRVRDTLVKVGSQHGVLRAMRLVRHHEDVGAWIQLGKGLRQVRFAELVDHRHYQV